MKKFDELNYYEILKIPMNSSYFKIKQAYKDALSLYDQDSVPTYSLFTREERDEILKRINDAHSTLIDDNKRAAYDRMLVDSGQVEAPISFRTKQYQSSMRSSGSTMADKDRLQSKMKEKFSMESIQNLSKELFSKELLSGNDLKKFRKALGIDIMEIYSITKISISVLNAIEENRFDRLPPDIYLKNFLKSYAKILQLDPQKVVDGYFKTICLSHPADG
ncbi:MAG: helix-turn-helix domain-containing protein [Desulfobacterales bacterium]|nr:helix-turn-helix domain-containing protein [Desulfobacterales bacterium]